MADAEPAWAVVGRCRGIDGRYFRVRVSDATLVKVPLPGSKRRIYVKQIVHENDIVWLYSMFTGKDFDGDPIAWTRTIDTIDASDHRRYKDVWRIRLSIDDRLLTLNYPVNGYDEVDLPYRVFVCVAGMLFHRPFIRKLSSRERVDA